MIALVAALACGGSPPSALPSGTWTLSAEGVLGMLDTTDGCRVGIWGPTWSTPGAAPVPCAVEQDDDGTWVRLPFETGSSEGEAALAVRLETLQAVLPLGLRDGEHQQELALLPGPPTEAARQAAAATAATSLATWRDAWKVGAFRVESAGQLVGEVAFRAGETARVGFYDTGWMTAGVVDALPLDEGPDLVLVFDAEPSLDGQPSVLRVNRPTNAAVVPLGLVPSPVEKRYTLVPGGVTPIERSEAQALAVMAASQRELDVGLRLATALAEAASARFFVSPGDSCPSLVSLGDDWPALLVGYDVSITRDGDGCGVQLEPAPVQHGRRLAARVSARGEVLDAVLRGL